MAAGPTLALLVLGAAVGLPVLVWLLVEAETDDTRVVDRETAEREARERYRRREARPPERDEDDA